MQFLCLSFSFNSSNFLPRMEECEQDTRISLVVNVSSYKIVESLPPTLFTVRTAGYNVHSRRYVRGVQVPARLHCLHKYRMWVKSLPRIRAFGQTEVSCWLEILGSRANFCPFYSWWATHSNPVTPGVLSWTTSSRSGVICFNEYIQEVRS